LSDEQATLTEQQQKRKILLSGKTRWLEKKEERRMGINMFTALMTRKSAQQKLAKDLLITTPNGIVEERFIKIGGIDQWITIRGEDRHNPVLFFVHGGPGSTYSVFTPLLRSWERHFTIVQWDQRGAGKTFRKNGKAGSGILTFERLTRDGIELAEFLREHLGQEKIILVGSSVGSITGTTIVKRRPDLFSAYVGTDQSTGPDALELSYQLTLGWLRAAGNTKGVKAVEKLGARRAHPTPRELTQLHQWTIKANPTIPDMIRDIMLPAMLTSPDHTIGDLRDIMKGMNFSNDQLFQELLTIDLRQLGMRFEVPFFIFQGDTDAINPTALAKAYFDELEAPHKEFVLIKQAGHLAAFARPEQFLNELLQRVRPLVLNPVVSAK
jgi:pimeloyl-ACP methyl ester carboxylesterase